MLRKLGKSSDGVVASPLSIIGADVRIVGNITTEGEMQIDGRVEGDISCKTLVIGASAHIVGEVKAETIRIHGEVSGRLAADQVTIGRTGRVTGDICHGSLEIQSGAQVEGHFLRRDAQPETVALPKPSGKSGNGKDEADNAIPPVVEAETEAGPATIN